MAKIETKRKPTVKQRKAAELATENLRRGTMRTMGEILLDAGYSKDVAERPSTVTESDGYKELMQQYLPDNKLLKKHEELTSAKRLDHMVFPLFTGEDDDEPDESLEPQAHGGALKRFKKQGSTLTDDDIIEMLKDVNCTVRKIVHGQTSRHVYFWSPDNQTQLKAVDLAYKLKGKIGGTQAPVAPVTNNTQINILDGEKLRTEISEVVRRAALGGLNEQNTNQ